MAKNSRENVEQEVLRVYSKVNPSECDVRGNKQLFLKIFKEQRDTYERLLCFPLKMFRGASLIEFGCGTGEYSLFYLQQGAISVHYDVNPYACERARSLFSDFGFDGTPVVNQSIFDFCLDEKWDIVVSNGVIHHTGDVKGAFAALSGCVAPQGFLSLGIATQTGFFQRNLQRLVLSRVSNGDDDSIEFWAERLFKDHISRAEKYGSRSRKQIIYDTYVNTTISAPTVKELLAWAREYGLTFYSAWPPITPAIFNESNVRPVFDFTDYPNLLSMSEFGWISNVQEDPARLVDLEKSVTPLVESLHKVSSCLNNIDTRRRYSHTERLKVSFEKLHGNFQSVHVPAVSDFLGFASEFKILLKLLIANDYKRIEKAVLESEFLFKGTSGLGHNQFMFQRRETCSEL
jgi:SAM-dependent methyltransferase